MKRVAILPCRDLSRPVRLNIEVLDCRFKNPPENPDGSVVDPFHGRPTPQRSRLDLPRTSGSNKPMSLSNPARAGGRVSRAGPTPRFTRAPLPRPGGSAKAVKLTRMPTPSGPVIPSGSRDTGRKPR